MPTMKHLIPADNEGVLDTTVKTLMRAVAMRDPLTASHSQRVSAYSLLIADAMSISDDDRNVLRYAAMMHDLGKIGVPEAILWKASLSSEEEACLQTHAKLTYELLAGLPFTNKLTQVPLAASCHLEKLDGSGYYRGLKGEAIPMPARIISVCNRFDELTHDYIIRQSPRTPIQKVYEALESERGTSFDPLALDALYGLGCDQLIEVMESGSGQSLPLDTFREITLYGLIELARAQGDQQKSRENDLLGAFLGIYNHTN